MSLANQLRTNKQLFTDSNSEYLLTDVKANSIGSRVGLAPLFLEGVGLSGNGSAVVGAMAAIETETLFSNDAIKVADLSGGVIDFTNVPLVNGLPIIEPDFSFNNLDISGDLNVGGNAVIEGGVISGSVDISGGNLTFDSSSKVRIGQGAGSVNQGSEAIAIGPNAGAVNQGSDAIAIGLEAGDDAQGSNAVAIGLEAGRTSQGSGAVAIGPNSGGDSQGTDAIAIGESAGNDNQGENAIAIGNSAGTSNQHDNSIILNATGSALNSDGTDRLFIAPIRDEALGIGVGVLKYNPTTKEITYSTT